MNAILLAGGKSRRFGRNKALIRIKEHTLIESIVGKLKSVFRQVYVVGNGEADYSFLEGVILVNDLLPDRGPLGGLYTGLQFSTEKDNFVTACDMPFLTAAFCRYLHDYREICRSDYDLLVPEYRGYLEPLAAVYSRNCLPAVESCLEGGNFKIKSFFPEVRVEVIREEIIRELGEPANLFFNINCRNDLFNIKGYREA